jgi:hypothetical protein
MSLTVNQDLRFINESIRATEPGWSLDATFEQVLGHLGRAMPGAFDLLCREGEPTPRSLADHIRNEVGGASDWPRRLDRAADHQPLPNPHARCSSSSSWGR